MTNLIVFSFAFCSPFSGRAGLWLSSQHPPGLDAPLWQQKPQSPSSEGCVRTRNPPRLPPQPARPWGREVGARQWGGCSSLELGLPGVRSSPALASQRCPGTPAFRLDKPGVQTYHLAVLSQGPPPSWRGWECTSGWRILSAEDAQGTGPSHLPKGTGAVSSHAGSGRGQQSGGAAGRDRSSRRRFEGSFQNSCRFLQIRFPT